MFLYHLGTQGGGGHGHGLPQGMVRESHLDAKCLPHIGDGEQVGFFHRGGIGRGALEQGDILIAHAAAGLHGRIDIGKGRDAGRDDHRLALAGRVFDQRNVGDLERGDLVERDI
ncbi:hypothetical protein D3C72_2049480 [compost metagenome]